MSTGGLFCIECGSEGWLYQNLCQHCLTKDQEVAQVPTLIDITYCVHCDDVQVAGHWDQRNLESAARDLTEDGLAIRDGVELTSWACAFTMRTEAEGTVSWEWAARCADLTFTAQGTTGVRYHRSVCPGCSRKQGGYFEAILQVRDPRGPIDAERRREWLQALEQELKRVDDRAIFLTKVAGDDAGPDYYLSNQGFARGVAQAWSDRTSGTLSESHSVTGRRDGIEIGRVTFLVRLPPYGRGDILRWRSTYWFVMRVSRRAVEVRPVAGAGERWVRYKELRHVRRIGGQELYSWTTLVVASAGEVQVLDPRNQRTITLVGEPVLNPAGDEILVMVLDDEVHLGALLPDQMP